MAKGRVLTQGFLTDVDVPSEERLAMHVDISRMTDVQHMLWVRGLQDLLRTIDVNYKAVVTGRREEKPLQRRRSVRVRYVKDEVGNQVKVASFHPYPSLLVNRLKGIRHRVYDALNQNCLILQEERVGRMKRKLYFLPASLAPELMERVEALNGELRALAGEIAEFEESGHFKDVIEHASKAGVEVNGFRANIPPIRVSPVPLSLSREFFTQYVEEEKRKALQEVDERRRAGLEALEREIQRKREEMLDALRKDLQGRFSTVMAMAEEAVKSALKGGRVSGQAASKRLKELSRLIEGMGIEFEHKPFEALGNVLSAASKRDVEGLKAAVNELAESLGVQPSGNPARDFELASKVARGKSLLLLTID